jgi:hypothetical protein
MMKLNPSNYHNCWVEQGETQNTHLSLILNCYGAGLATSPTLNPAPEITLATLD